MKIPVEDKNITQQASVTAEDQEDDTLYYRDLAEDLAALTPSELRKVVRAAKHLRKFVQLLDMEEDSEDE